jgi:hypothetical protein
MSLTVSINGIQQITFPTGVSSASCSGDTLTITLSGGGGGSIDLQTNGVDNATQSQLNIAASSSSSVTVANSGGTVTITGPLFQTNSSSNATQSQLNLVAGSNITLVNSGGNVTISASGGGSLAAGSNVIPSSERSSTDSGYTNNSIILRLPQGMLLCRPSSWKFSISLAGGASFVVSAGVVYRTTVDSNVVIDSTPVTWGGSSGPTLTAGETFSDSISLPIDTSHDYWIVVHFTSSSGSLNIGGSQYVSAFFHNDCGFVFGDQTGLTAGNSIPSVNPESDIYRTIST